MALPHNIFKKPLINSRELLEPTTLSTQQKENNEDESTFNENRLSYRMIFEEDEAIEQRKLIPDTEVDELLAAKDDEWQKRVKLEQIKSHRQGYEKGYADGEKEATEKTREQTKGEVVNSFQGLQQALSHVEENLSQLHSQIEPGICSLVFAIAEQVIGIPVHKKELEEQISRELRSIFKSMQDAQKIELWCSRTDLQYVESLTIDLSLSNIVIETDGELLPGEYRVETNQRKVVRDFKKSLNELMGQLPIEQWGKSELTEDE